MAWTTTDLTNLDEAIAQGITTVSIAGKTITYRSLDEMMRLRASMAREIGLTSAQMKKTRTFATFSRK